MDLDLSPEESELRDNVRSVLARVCPPAGGPGGLRGQGRRRRRSGSAWSSSYWPALAIAEEHGGLGLGFVELALVAEELGRAVVPGPFLATATQFAPAVRELGDDGAAGRATCSAGSQPAS